MKKTLLVLLFILIPGVLLSQNAVELVRSVRSVATTVCRHITVPVEYTAEALSVGLAQSYKSSFETYSNSCEIQISIQKQLVSQSIKSPELVYGPYNYMRVFSKAAQNPELINKQYRAAWKKIHKTTGYNGVHHLISKSTLKRIYEDLKRKGVKTSLSDLEANTPSIFHPLHGNPEYTSIFHNIDQQYHSYYAFGMKKTIENILSEINELNRKVGLKPMPDWYVSGVMREAELWCSYYGLTW